MYCTVLYCIIQIAQQFFFSSGLTFLHANRPSPLVRCNAYVHQWGDIFILEFHDLLCSALLCWCCHGLCWHVHMCKHKYRITILYGTGLNDWHWYWHWAHGCIPLTYCTNMSIAWRHLDPILPSPPSCHYILSIIPPSLPIIPHQAASASQSQSRSHPFNSQHTTTYIYHRISKA